MEYINLLHQTDCYLFNSESIDSNQGVNHPTREGWLAAQTDKQANALLSSELGFEVTKVSAGQIDILAQGLAEEDSHSRGEIQLYITSANQSTPNELSSVKTRVGKVVSSQLPTSNTIVKPRHRDGVPVHEGGILPREHRLPESQLNEGAHPGSYRLRLQAERPVTSAPRKQAKPCENVRAEGRTTFGYHYRINGRGLQAQPTRRGPQSDAPPSAGMASAIPSSPDTPNREPAHLRPTSVGPHLQDGNHRKGLNQDELLTKKQWYKIKPLVVKQTREYKFDQQQVVKDLLRREAHPKETWDSILGHKDKKYISYCQVRLFQLQQDTTWETIQQIVNSTVSDDENSRGEIVSPARPLSPLSTLVDRRDRAGGRTTPFPTKKHSVVPNTVSGQSLQTRLTRQGCQSDAPPSAAMASAMPSCLGAPYRGPALRRPASVEFDHLPQASYLLAEADKMQPTSECSHDTIAYGSHSQTYSEYSGKLTNDQWKEIQMKAFSSRRGAYRHDYRKIIDTIIYKQNNRYTQWTSLTTADGWADGLHCSRMLSYWNRQGVWDKIAQVLELDT